MIERIDLNADLGESVGPKIIGDDDAMLDIVSSANVACGFHAGNPDVMARTMRSAARRGVGIGAHPGFADLEGFGRRRMDLPADSLSNLVCYQVGAAQGMAHAVGAKLKHLKLHGALSNMACEDKALAITCFRAALSVVPELVVVVLPATAQEFAAKEIGCPVACEIFSDRAYNDDATLIDRKEAGAVIHNPEVAASRVVEMVRAKSIIARSGKRIPTQIDTICVHGDTPDAVKLANVTRSALEDAGLSIVAFGC